MRLERRLVATLLMLVSLVAASQVRSETATVPPPADMSRAGPPSIRHPSHIEAGHRPPPASVPTNPFKGDKATAATGASLFASMNCDGCHGGGALGFAGPSLADGRWRYGGDDEELFQSIFYGRPKGMPAFGGALGSEGIWILVTYLQSLPVPDVVPTQSWEAIAPVATAAAAAEPAAAAPADTSAEGLLTKYVCSACHAVDTKLVGPSFKQVAAKYRDDKKAGATLAAKVKNGGAGVWGEVPMPPNAGVPDEDLHAMITWILALK
jgi:cytochrome c551/c552